MSKVLIIGSTGIIGSAVAEACTQGHDVLALGKDRGYLAQDIPFVRYERGSPSADIADITNAKWDAIVDLCAYTARDSATTFTHFDVNACHYIVLSTTLVYDRALTPPFVPIKESSRRIKDERQGTYAYDKFCLEDWVLPERRRTRPLHRPARTILRPYHVLGRHSLLGCTPPTNRDPLLITKIENEEPIPLPDGGRIPMQFINPWDIGRVIRAMIGKEQTFGQAYNLVHEKIYTVREYYEEIARQLGRNLDVKSSGAERCWDTPSGWNITVLPHMYSTEKLKKAVGWHSMPAISLQESVQEAIESQPTCVGAMKNIPVHQNMCKGHAMKRPPHY